MGAMPDAMQPAPLPSVYQLRVVVHGVSPLIWRRLLLPADTTIAGLHAVLQIAFGWTGTHLHRFVVQGREYGIGYVGGPSFGDDPRRVRLGDLGLRRTERFTYHYDFSAGWCHDLRVEQILGTQARPAHCGLYGWPGLSSGMASIVACGRASHALSRSPCSGSMSRSGLPAARSIPSSPSPGRVLADGPNPNAVDLACSLVEDVDDGWTVVVDYGVVLFLGFFLARGSAFDDPWAGSVAAVR